MIGRGHPHIFVWGCRCVVCAGMAGFIALGEVYVENVVLPCGSILAWQDVLAGAGSPR